MIDWYTSFTIKEVNIVDINKIMKFINGLNQEQRKYYNRLYKNSLKDELLDTLRKGTDFIDEAMKVTDIKEKEYLVTLFLLYLIDKQHNQKNR